MSAFLIFTAYLLFLLLFYSTTLWIAGKLLKYTASTFARATTVILVIFVLGILFFLPQLFLPPALQLPSALIAIAAQIFSTWYLIKRILRTTTGRAWAGFGVLALTQIAGVCIGIFVVRSFFIEAFSIPTNSMSPTIRAVHRVGTCPACGGQLMIDAPTPDIVRPDPYLASIPQLGICASCFHREEIPAARLTTPTHQGDRILITKFLTARRWDIIVFRAKIGDNYVKRLVAFPGEHIAITADGKILINGSPIGNPPDQPKLTFPLPDLFGKFPHAPVPDFSLRLGPDEYFVLGDNSTRSNDSRFTGPIHAADIIGVTTMIYWPPNRLKIIR